MKLKLQFTFDNNIWNTTDIGEESVEKINELLWILLHTLEAKEVVFKMEEEDEKK